MPSETSISSSVLLFHSPGARGGPWVKKDLEAKLGLRESENEEHSPKKPQASPANPLYLRKLRPERDGPFPGSHKGKSRRSLLCPLDAACPLAAQEAAGRAPFILSPPGPE